ncbi:MAG: GtrA family protein [Vicinamibacterales bacterium]
MRWTRFIGVGVLGFLLQLATLWVLTSRAGWSWLPATIASVELAVLHNFLWHSRWTWSDRGGERWTRLARFQFANGLASIAGNAALMTLFAGALGWPSIPANICAVALMAVANFTVADRWVFARAREGS